MKAVGHIHYDLWMRYGFPFYWATPEKRVHLAWRSYAGRVISKCIREGTMLRAKNCGIPCVDCGAPPAHWEHRDYTKPLMVVPCCMSCNFKRGPGIHPDYVPDPTIQQLNYHRFQLRRLSGDKTIKDDPRYSHGMKISPINEINALKQRRKKSA